MWRHGVAATSTAVWHHRITIEGDKNIQTAPGRRAVRDDGNHPQPPARYGEGARRADRPGFSSEKMSLSIL